MSVNIINTGFGFSKNAPLPTQKIVDAIKYAGSNNNSISTGSHNSTPMPSRHVTTQNANTTATAK